MSKRVVKRVERGWAGHFILSHRCMFRRNTPLTCERKRIIVSTVGAMLKHPEQESAEIDMIGHNRWYKTMAFRAHLEGPYIEIDARKKVYFESPWSIEAKKEKDLPDDVDRVANDMHEAVVAELTKKMAHGEIPKPEPDAPVWEDE